MAVALLTPDDRLLPINARKYTLLLQRASMGRTCRRGLYVSVRRIELPASKYGLGISLNRPDSLIITM